MLQELVAISKPTPLKFQRFCGENPDLWISQAERYFGFYEIAENQKLSLASSYLDGEALTWYQWLFQNKQLVDWEHFTAKVLIRFRKRHLKSPKGRLADLWQWSDISALPWPQNNDEQSEYPTKIDEHKVFDEMLKSNYSKVFTVEPLDISIEMPGEDAIGPDRSEVQLFYESPQINMSEGYVTTTSLDCGSCHQQIEFAFFEDMYLAEFFSETESIDDLYLDNFLMKNEGCIPTSELPSDEIILDIKPGKYNKGVEHDEGMAIMDPYEWEPGVTSKDRALTGCTVNVEPLLLLGSTGAFCFIKHTNDMTQVWDPGLRWNHLLIFSADALVCASYYDDVGKIYKGGTSQVFYSVIAGQTEKILRDQVAFQMVIVFDPGGCTFDIPILEDRNEFPAEISKAWNFSMANRFDRQNREMSNTSAQAKKLKCDVKVRGLIVTLKWWLSKHNTFTTTYGTFVLFAILRDLYAHIHMKWLTAVELVLLVTLATVALTNREVATEGKSYFILVGEPCGVCKTGTTAMIKHYFSYFDGLRSIEEHPVEHDVLNTNYTDKASSSWLLFWVMCSPFNYATVVTFAAQFVGVNVHSTVVFGKSLFVLEGFGNENTIFDHVSRLMVVARSIQDHILYCINIAQFVLATIGGQHGTNIVLESNLEDKVLIEDGSIVNQTWPITQLVIGLRKKEQIWKAFAKVNLISKPNY